MDERELKVEKAKGFFVIAQLSIILAGLLFASSGVAYSGMFNSFDKAVEISFSYNNSDINTSQQILEIYGGLVEVNFSLYKIFLISGFVAVSLSFFFWLAGFNKINKIN